MSRVDVHQPIASRRVRRFDHSGTAAGGHGAPPAMLRAAQIFRTGGDVAHVCARPGERIQRRPLCLC
eukprot:1409109-Prymnesium_polylepis.1